MTDHLLARLADDALEVPIVPSFSRIGPAVRRRLWHWDDLPRIGGQVVVVTGGTSGLGRATAELVGRAGAHVVLVGRDGAKGAKVLDDLRAQGVEAELHLADVGDLASVRALARTLAEAHPSIHALVHGAGALLPDRRVETAQGLEVTWATMVVGPHLLTELLADRTERAIWVSSGGMYTQAVDLGDVGWERRPWAGAKAYAQAKRAQVDLVLDAAARGEAPIPVAMHPGWADTPGVVSGLPTFHKVMGPLLRSPAEGADTIAWLATIPAPDLEPGAFYLDRRPRRTAYLPKTATSAADRTRLRDLVEAQAHRT